MAYLCVRLVRLWGIRIPTDPADSPISATLAALADDTRREILRYLIADSDGVATYEELVRHLSEGSDEPLEQLVASVHHRHVPKLADLDIVEYDAWSGTVRYLGDSLSESVLEAIEEN